MYNRIVHGEIAQLARAFGSYPTGRRFESTSRYQETHTIVWVLFSCNFKMPQLCCDILKFGGDGGSRTLVQYSIHINFYECSLLFFCSLKILQINTLDFLVSFYYPLFPRNETTLFPTLIGALFASVGYAIERRCNLGSVC